MRTMDNRVLLKPFTERGVIESKTPGGIKFIGNYDHLVKSVALADGPDGIKTGDAIFVKGVSLREPWTKTVFDIGDGLEGLLAPREAIVLVDPARPVEPPVTATPSHGRNPGDSL